MISVKSCVLPQLWLLNLCCIEFQDSSTSNTHPMPRATLSVIAPITIAKMPDGLCHILYAFLAGITNRQEKLLDTDLNFKVALYS